MFGYLLGATSRGLRIDVRVIKSSSRVIESSGLEDLAWGTRLTAQFYTQVLQHSHCLVFNCWAGWTGRSSHPENKVNCALLSMSDSRVLIPPVISKLQPEVPGNSFPLDSLSYLPKKLANEASRDANIIRWAWAQAES